MESCWVARSEVPRRACRQTLAACTPFASLLRACHPIASQFGKLFRFLKVGPFEHSRPLPPESPGCFVWHGRHLEPGAGQAGGGMVRKLLGPLVRFGSFAGGRFGSSIGLGGSLVGPAACR